MIVIGYKNDWQENTHDDRLLNSISAIHQRDNLILFNGGTDLRCSSTHFVMTHDIIICRELDHSQVTIQILHMQNLMQKVAISFQRLFDHKLKYGMLVVYLYST